jgi:alpha-galactosidase
MLEREEFPGWGGTRYYEPASRSAREMATATWCLHYVSHNASRDDTLDITLKDIRDDIEVTLHYRVYPGHGILERSATIVNKTVQAAHCGKRAIRHLEPARRRRLSAHLPHRPLGRRNATESRAIHQGMKVLESRKGHTSHNINPWFAIDAGDAGEDHGGVWFGALAWSGNWRITVEQTPYRQVRVTGGLNTFDFAYPLKPGESLDTPPSTPAIRPTDSAAPRACCIASSASRSRPAASARASPGALQLLGSHHLRRQRSRPEGNSPTRPRSSASSSS